MAPELEASLSQGLLYDRVILGKTSKNKAGEAFYPPDGDILSSVDGYFDSVIKGKDQGRKFFSDLKQGILHPYPGSRHLDNALEFLELGHKFEKIEDIKKGLKGIISGDTDATEDQIDLAKRFAIDFYDHR